MREPHELVVLQSFRRKAKGKGASFEAGVGDDVFEMLRRDATALAKNFHPNVARVRHVDVSADELRIATELIDGVTLADLFAAASKRKDPPLPIAVLVRILVDVLGGLHGLQGLRENGAALGTFHGALCPANVVLGKDGVARIVSVFRPRPVSIVQGSEAVAYAAPEALDLGGSNDPRTDLYAVGVMLWEGLAGKRLFDEKHPGRVLQRQREEEMVKPTVAESSGFAKLADAAMRALAYEPALRFRSPSEMATELRRVAGTRLAPGSAVAQKVMDLAGDRIRNRRAELDQSATGARKRPVVTTAASAAEDRATTTPPEPAITAPPAAITAPPARAPAEGRVVARAPTATKSEPNVRIADEVPATPTPSPALEAIAIAPKPGFPAEQPTSPAAPPKIQPNASRAPLPKPPAMKPPVTRAPITAVEPTPEAAPPKVLPSVREAKPAQSKPRIVAKIAEPGPKFPVARAPITGVTPTDRRGDVAPPPESGPELTGERHSGSVPTAPDGESGTWLEAPDPDVSSRSVLAAPESAPRIPADRRSGPMVASTPDAVESGPVVAPAPTSAPRLAFDFAAAPDAPPPELPLRTEPAPEPPPEPPSSSPAIADAPRESGRRIALAPASEDDASSGAARQDVRAGWSGTSTPSGEIVPVAPPRRRLLPVVLAVVALAVLVTGGAIVSAVGRSASPTLVPTAAASGASTRNADTATAPETATATATETATAPDTATPTATATIAANPTAPDTATSTTNDPMPVAPAASGSAPGTDPTEVAPAPRAPYVPQKRKAYEPLGI
ncbi:MAG TPA: protein kinase [Labilithrix sp.]